MKKVAPELRRWFCPHIWDRGDARFATARAEFLALLAVINALDRHTKSYADDGDRSYDFERVLAARARLERASGGRK